MTSDLIQLECEERQRQIDQQWQMLPVLFAQWKAQQSESQQVSQKETVASRVLYHTAQDIKRIAERCPADCGRNAKARHQ